MRRDSQGKESFHAQIEDGVASKIYDFLNVPATEEVGPRPMSMKKGNGFWCYKMHNDMQTSKCRFIFGFDGAPVISKQN